MSKLGNSSSSNFFIRCTLYLNYVFVTAIVLSYLSNFINPNFIWIFSFFGILYPLFLIANLFFILVWIYLRKPYFFLSLFVILLGCGHIGKYLQFSFTDSDSINNRAINILSFNVQNFSKEHSGVFNKEVQEKTFQFLEEQNADIVCIQEYSYAGENIYASHAQLKKRLRSNNYLYESYFKPGQGKVVGLVSFSRYPIVGKGIFDMEDTRKFGIFTDLKIHHDTIRVYNIHLESIRLNADDYIYLTSNSTRETDYKGNARLVVKKMIMAYKKRARQVDVLQKHIKDSPYPIIISGDFNDTPVSYTYHQLASNYQDAFACKGSGIGNTLIGKIPAFRIDYVLYDKSFTPLSYEEINIELSDHYPIKSSFSIQ